jgi:hypothetical protein
MALLVQHGHDDEPIIDEPVAHGVRQAAVGALRSMMSPLSLRSAGSPPFGHRAAR